VGILKYTFLLVGWDHVHDVSVNLLIGSCVGMVVHNRCIRHRHFMMCDLNDETQKDSDTKFCHF